MPWKSKVDIGKITKETARSFSLQLLRSKIDIATEPVDRNVGFSFNPILHKLFYVRWFHKGGG